MLATVIFHLIFFKLNVLKISKLNESNFTKFSEFLILKVAHKSKLLKILKTTRNPTRTIQKKHLQLFIDQNYRQKQQLNSKQFNNLCFQNYIDIRAKKTTENKLAKLH